jgi:hypothetical protein
MGDSAQPVTARHSVARDEVPQAIRPTKASNAQRSHVDTYESLERGH